MRLSEVQKVSMIERNQDEYGRSYGALSWVTPQMATDAEHERDALLKAISIRGEIGASETKTDTSRLAPGCKTCMEGKWSCLFINGRCNGRCFYCPTPQDEVGEPATNHLAFPSPDDYAAYVAALGFTGMSISGGEPFLTFERSLAYIQAVRERLGAGIHIWLYTNGTRVTREKLRRLASAGLDEIRFDIGAINYTLKKPAMADGIIPTVTVEIPMVPEEKERLQHLLAPMASAGISHLNLHQLRLTPHNIRHLAWKEYTFLHGNRTTILESELGALEIVRHALEHHLDLGVNYCSFVYKQRYQGAGARTRAAETICKPWESITRNGYIRKVCLLGNGAPLNAVTTQLHEDGHQGLYMRDDEGLHLPAHLIPRLLPEGLSCRVAYDEAALSQTASFALPEKEIPLHNRSIYAERMQRKEAMVVSVDPFSRAPLETTLEQWELSAPFEAIPRGLLPYF